MNIQDLVKEANQNYLQSEWDKFLIDGWFQPNRVMRYLVKDFMKTHKISYKEFDLLKRVPLYQTQQKCTVTRFVAAYFPVISNMLWNNVETKETIVKALKKQKMLSQSIDSAKVQQEQLEMKKARKEAMSEGVSHRLVKEQRESNSRSNWSVCK